MLVREVEMADMTAAMSQTTRHALLLDGTTGTAGTGVMKRMPLPPVVQGFTTDGTRTSVLTASIENDLDNNKASGQYSHAEGHGTTASGFASHAEGGGANQQTAALGYNSHAEGGDTKAYGRNSHSEGGDTIAYAKNSHAEGVSSKSGFEIEVKVTPIESRTSSTSSISLVIVGDYHSVYPVDNIVNLVSNDNDGLSTGASYSYYRNFGKVTSSTYNSTTGRTTLVINDTTDGLSTFSKNAVISHIENSNSTTTIQCRAGLYSHAEGRGTISTGDNSHSEGRGSEASGFVSHAEGWKTVASGQMSHAEGQETIAGGKGSFASGYSTAAYTQYSHAEGNSTTAGIKGYKVLSCTNSTTSGWKKIEVVKELYDKLVIDTTVVSFRQADFSLFNSNYKVRNKLESDNKYYFEIQRTNNISLTWLVNIKNDWSAGTESGGNYTHSEGNKTLAIGTASHSEGDITKAIGEASHTEGRNTQAIGNYAHAEGNATQASGVQSHSEGASTIASGPNSHASGSTTTASGENSYASGYKTKAIGNNSHSEGGVYTSTSGGSDTITEACSDGAHAEGKGTKSYGIAAHSEGHKTKAGTKTTTSGVTTYAGDSAHAEGRETTASADYSHAEGHLSTASGIAAHAEGNQTSAVSTASHSEGYQTTAGAPNKNNAHAEGNQSEATGSAAHSEGFKTKASGDYSHAEGSETQASGLNSHSEGTSSVASGESSHAGGKSSTASGNNSYAGGYECIASGKQSFAIGYQTAAKGNHSHASGLGTIANGKATIASGKYNIEQITTEDHSIASGNTITLNQDVEELTKVYQQIEGNYIELSTTEYTIAANVITLTTAVTVATNFRILYKPGINSYGDFAHIIGGGESGSRKNISVLDWNGNLRIKGDLYVECEGDSTGGIKIGTGGSGTTEWTTILNKPDIHPSQGSGGSGIELSNYVNNTSSCYTTVPNTIVAGQYANNIVSNQERDIIEASDKQYDATNKTISGTFKWKNRSGARVTRGTVDQFRYLKFGTKSTYTEHEIIQFIYNGSDQLIKIKLASGPTGSAASQFQLNSNKTFVCGAGTSNSYRKDALALTKRGDLFLSGEVVVNCNNDSTSGTRLAPIPECPTTTDGTYILQCVVTNGVPQYQWVLE